MKERQDIVPVQLLDNPDMHVADYHQDKNCEFNQLACQVTINGTDIKFYNGVDNYILQTVLAEVRNAH